MFIIIISQLTHSVMMSFSGIFSVCLKDFDFLINELKVFCWFHFLWLLFFVFCFSIFRGLHDIAYSTNDCIVFAIFVNKVTEGQIQIFHVRNRVLDFPIMVFLFSCFDQQFLHLLGYFPLYPKCENKWKTRKGKEKERSLR